MSLEDKKMAVRRAELDDDLETIEEALKSEERVPCEERGACNE